MESEIRFVIVEDEPLILQQLEYSICACSPQYHVVGKASNGKDGLLEIKQHRPDIIITDIQMPMMSGLDMIAQAREDGMGGHYLILSGYGEFQYAQSALRLGVDDYLLKPIDPDDLELQLKGLTEKIEQGKEHDFAAYVRQWFNLDVRPKEIASLPNGEVCYFIFAEVGAAASRTYGEFSPGVQFWKENSFDWLEKVQDKWNIHIEHFSGKYANEHIFAMIQSKEGESKQIRMIAEDIFACCQDKLPVCMIVTEGMHDPADFVQQIHSAAECRMMALPFGSSGVWCMGFDQLPAISEVLPDSFRKLSTKIVEQMPYQDSEVLEQLVMYWESEQPCEAVLLRQLEYLLGKLGDNGHETDTLTAGELLADALDFHDVVDTLYPFLRTPMAVDKNVGASGQITEIKRYIDQNYDKSLNYRVLYENFGYNEKYIAYLFKKEMGISPSKYIVNVRIEAAKRLLLTRPDLLQKDVAQKVGFTDPLYFSRVFRDIVGLSPSKFVKRNRHS